MLGNLENIYDNRRKCKFCKENYIHSNININYFSLNQQIFCHNYFLFIYFLIFEITLYARCTFLFRIIFIFHKNNNVCVKAKVRPPRLNGKRIGVFATRAPYRPNPIGLTLAKIERISGEFLCLLLILLFSAVSFWTVCTSKPIFKKRFLETYQKA